MKEIERALARADTISVSQPPTAPSPFQSALSDDFSVTTETVQDPADAPSTKYNVLQADYDQFRLLAGARSRQAVSVDGAFRVLRTHLLDAMSHQGMRVVGITSPTASVGKTMTSIQLALACARRVDRTITLADFDYRRPAVAEYLSASSFVSSTEYFRGNRPVTDFLTQNEQGNLTYLLTREPTDMSAEYLASPRMDSALKTLTRNGSIVIADLPPLIGCDDTLAIMPKLDGVVLVVGCGEHSYGMMEQVQEMVPSEKLIGAVLNRVPRVDTKYKYTYSVST